MTKVVYSSKFPTCKLDKINEAFGLNLRMDEIIYEHDNSVHKICDRLNYSKEKSIDVISKILESYFSNLEYMMIKYSTIKFNSIVKLSDENDRLCHSDNWKRDMLNHGFNEKTYYNVYLTYNNTYSNEIIEYIIKSYLDENGYFLDDIFFKEENYYEKHYIDKDFKITPTDTTRSITCYDIPIKDLPDIMSGKINPSTTIKTSRLSIYVASDVRLYIETEIETDDMEIVKSINIPLEAILNNDFSLVENKEICHLINNKFEMSKQKDMLMSRTNVWKALKQEIEKHKSV